MRIIPLLLFFIFLFFIGKEVRKMYLKTDAESELDKVKTDEELFEMEREAILRKRSLKEKKEELIKTLSEEA